MTTFHIFAAGDTVFEETTVRKISIADVFDALRQGGRDFLKKPSQYIFVVLIYPIIGMTLVRWASGGNALQLLYPLMTGFALLGPLAALGLYEMSRRIERGQDTSWMHAFDVAKSPAIPAIIAVGTMLFALFFLWLYVAQGIYTSIYGPAVPESFVEFFRNVVSTREGWTLILLGNAAGFCFALVVLSTTVVAFPLLLDRDVGAVTAITTSIKAVAMNIIPMLTWGLIVALLLLVGALPVFAGLVVVLPILGHATWHIYRKVVVGSGPGNPANLA